MRWPFRVAAVLFCVAGVSSANEPAADPVDEVVHRWLAAVGGDHGSANVRSVRVRSRANDDGLASQTEEWLDRDSWRRITTKAGRTREEVCRGAVAWVKDWNGKVLELRGRDLREQLTDAAVATLLFGVAPGEVVVGGIAQRSVEAAPQTSDVLRFTPKGGAPIDVVLDATTSLPTRIIRKSSGDTITLELSDWRTVKGRKVPYALRRTEGDGEDVATADVLQVKPSSRVVTPPIGRPKDGAPDYRFASGRSALGIPFNFENDHLMIDGRVNGSKPLWFMLDTGAEATIVNRARLTELHIEPFGASTIRGGGNTTAFAFADVARFDVGGLTILNQRVGVIDLTGLEKIYGMPMGGLLGYDFFSRFVVRVDYDAKTIDLLNPSDYAYTGSGTSVPFVLEEFCPHLASTITVPSTSPIAADLLVDAGAADTVNLASPFVKAHRLLELARKQPAGGPNTMAGSEKEFFAQTSVRGRLGSVTLGPFTLTDIPSNLMVGTTGAYASERFSGVIGEGVLRRFNTVYDYSRSVMILEPNATFGTPFPGRKTFGATLLSDGPGYTHFTVTGVRKDSPAEAAGLRKGDLILAADGVPATEMRLADVRKILTDEGVHHVLAVRRGDDAVGIEFTVTLVSLDEK